MRPLCCVLVSMVMIGACTPALDWRQARFAEIGLEAQFPCKPAGLAREVSLAGKRVPMELHGCAADGSTYAVGAIALDDVREVGQALDALRTAAAQNLQATPGPLVGFTVPGMTPNPLAGRVALTGRRPDGSAVVQHLLVFARGTRVYQVSVLGNAPAQAAMQQFFAGVRAV